jgi:hypothetical protein
MLGLAVGGFVLHFPGSYGDLTGWELAPGIFGLVLGAVNGVVFGILLWFAAGGGWAVGRRLIVFGALAVGSTHGLHDASSFLTPYPIVAAASGALVAVAWWLAFREGPPWQAGVAGVAWGIGLIAASAGSTALGLPWEQTPVGWSTDHAVQGLLVGLVWGGATVRIRPSTGDATSRPLPRAAGRPD